MKRKIVSAILLLFFFGFFTPAQAQYLKDCDDNNLCTIDVLDEGKCVYFAVEDGTSCGRGKECFHGQCEEAKKVAALIMQKEERKTSFSPELVNAVPLVALVIALIIVIQFFKRSPAEKKIKTEKKKLKKLLRPKEELREKSLKNLMQLRMSEEKPLDELLPKK